ncbi:hypothetical protein BURPS1710b_0884 [Burkholderia pseudomallei 1710b]|uniref:Uncharacterized protein n=1 Tax=Burkholderia pseudomallei (strain 1710b) TaxID=320372 RepID=Q3JVV6_BURP1|nr:hypothetical protein BURPS1710b_0884 [Burkholderia pseudomallei 1710b]
MGSARPAAVEETLDCERVEIGSAMRCFEGTG